METKTRFDGFTFKSYSDKYLCNGPLYDMLYSILEKLEPTTHRLIEVGSGPNAPASRFLAKTATHPINYCLIEPSKASAELKPFVESLTPPSTGVIIQQSASSEEARAQPQGDVVVSNRMIHEWRLFELSTGAEWTVKNALEILLRLTKKGGHVVLGDFSFSKEYSELKDDDPKLITDMEALKSRIGHTHPPRDYITIEQVEKAAEELGVNISYKHVIEKPEPDTNRIYWMVVIDKE